MRRLFYGVDKASQVNLRTYILLIFVDIVGTYYDSYREKNIEQFSYRAHLLEIYNANIATVYTSSYRAHLLEIYNANIATVYTSSSRNCIF